jgi:hypothetical protein
MLVAGLATDRCLALFRERRASETLSSNANRLLQRLAHELTFAREASLQPVTLQTQGSDWLSFQRSLGVVAGVVQWGPTVVLCWEREPAELDNGGDDDGDGLVDEGELVRIEDEGTAAERRVVLAHGLCELLPGETFDGTDEDGDGLIDERGLCASLAGGVLTLRLGLSGRTPAGIVLTRVVETSVFVRN